MSDTAPNTDPSPTPTPTPRFRDAYQRYIDEIRAVPNSELVAINIDIPSAVTTTLGALPEIIALRPQILSDIPRFNLARFDKLEGYTLALGHAHTLWLAASAPQQSIEELAKTAASARELLASDASALAARSFLDGQKLRELKGPVGYRNLAFDLFTLATLLRVNWDNIAGKTAVELSELDNAETLADRLLTLVGAREQGPAVVAESADIRHRSFSLFVQTYDDARRAISYLRWHEEDVDTIAPSLYAGRGKHKAAAPTAPSEPPAAPSGKPAAAPALQAGASEPPAREDGATHGLGLPDSSPFTHS